MEERQRSLLEMKLLGGHALMEPLELLQLELVVVVLIADNLVLVGLKPTL